MKYSFARSVTTSITGTLLLSVNLNNIVRRHSGDLSLFLTHSVNFTTAEEIPLATGARARVPARPYRRSSINLTAVKSF